MPNLAPVFTDLPKACKTHLSPNAGIGNACPTCDIFATWVLKARAKDFTLTQLEILTGVPMIYLRRAVSLALFRERYGDWVPSSEL